MKTFTFLIITIFAVGKLTAKAHSDSTSIPYTEAKHYFVRDDYPDRNFHMLKIVSEEMFSGIFGMAAVMGDGGQPTNIDFSKSYVIALIDQTSQTTKNISLKSLFKQQGQIFLDYTITNRPTSNTAQFRFCKLLIVENKYDGPVHAYSSSKDGIPMPGSDLDEYGCKPSTGSIWSIILNDCIQPWNTPYVLEGKEINAHENASLLFSTDMRKAEIIGSKYGRNIILDRADNNDEWLSDTLMLIKTSTDSFSLIEKSKEIATGRSREQ